MLAPVIYIRHTEMSRRTNFGIYPFNYTAGSFRRPCHVNHVVHGMHVIIRTIHTLLSRHTNFGIYQINQTAATAPTPWYVNPAIHGMHITILGAKLLKAAPVRPA